MKKVFFMCVASAVLVFTSCGDKKEEGGDKKMTACDCLKKAEEFQKKMAADPSKREEIMKEAESFEKQCKDFKQKDYAKCEGGQKPAENDKPAEQTDNSEMSEGQVDGPADMPDGVEMPEMPE